MPTFLFCLSSMWFVLRSIVLGICWIFNIVKSGVSFVYLKLKQTSFVEKHIEIIEKLGVIVKVIMHFVYAIFYPFKWFWSHVIIPINNCWKRYEIRRAGFGDRCPLLTDNFSLSIGRRLASGIVGLVIFALIGVLSIVDFEEIREERERTRRYEQHIAWRNSLAHSENPTLEEKKAMGSFYFYFISFKVNKARTFKAASASLVDGANARDLVNASIKYLEAVIEDKYERDCPEDFIVTGKIFLEECAKELLVRVKNTYGETIIKETFESNEKVKQNANLKQKCEMAYRSIRFQTVNWDLDSAKYDFESVIERYGGNEVLTKWFTERFTSESNNGESSILEVPKGVCVPFKINSEKNKDREFSMTYLGKYKVGKLLTHAFYWPKSESGDREDILFIEIHEFQVMPKLGWTVYLQVEGDDIDKFHKACVEAVSNFRKMTSDKVAQVRIDRETSTLSDCFPKVSYNYYLPSGLYKDQNEAIPVAYYVPYRDYSGGKHKKDLLLIGAQVRRWTGEITGQQGWWREPPYEMIMGIALYPNEDSSHVETFLNFSNRNFIENVIKKRGANQKEKPKGYDVLSSTDALSMSNGRKLCKEFVGNSNIYTYLDECSVKWDVGGESPPFICGLTFHDNGFATLIQDNTFLAKEYNNVPIHELAKKLEIAFLNANPANTEVKNVSARVENGKLLFMGDISVETGNVKEQVNKLFKALNQARIFLRAY